MKLGELKGSFNLEFDDRGNEPMEKWGKGLKGRSRDK